MRNANALELSAAWWKKEAPEGLGAAGEGFADALAAYAKAEARLAKPSRKALEAYEDALSALETAGEKVAAAARASEKAAKDDRDRARAFKTTAAAMGRPLSRKIDAARDAAEEMEEALEEAETPFADPDAHAAYIQKIAQKLKRQPHNFALALTSNDPADMRFVFHRRKGGRSLLGRLRRALPVKRFTFGVAGSRGLAEELGAETVSKRTLVLYLEGRQIPSLARRVRLMLRRLGVSAFTKVSVVEDGREIDSAADEEDDRLDPLEDGDDDSAAPARTARASAPARERTKASEAGARLRRRLARLQEIARHLPRARARAATDVLGLAKSRIDRGALGAAERAIAALEGKLSGRPRPAPRAEPGAEPAPAPKAARLAALGRELKRLGAEAKPRLAANPGERARAMAAFARAKALLDARAAEEAAREIAALAALLEALAPAGQGAGD